MNGDRLVMQGIGKRFQATQALKDVSLTAKAGHVLALIGENGAGKSTLMKILSGAHAPDEGSMSIDNVPYQPKGPLAARLAGVAMVYQELNLASHLSVEDNVMLGQEAHRFGLLKRSQQRQRVREVLSSLGYPELSLTRPVGALPIGAQQIVEIARGLLADAKVMVFDEPTSSLSRQDVAELFRSIRRLTDKGLSIIYISHYLEELREIADDYVVLRDGRSVGAGKLASVSDSELIALMIGRSVDNLFPSQPHSIGKPILEIRNLSGREIPKCVNLTLHRGEIFGLFGLIGAGRTELLRLLFGLDRPVEGEILSFNSKGRVDISRTSVKARVDHGWGMVSEDRKGEGLAQSMSISDNLSLSSLQRYRRFGLLQESRRHGAMRDWMKRLEVKAASSLQSIYQLSGGNQQKVAIARVMHQGAAVYLFDEPTRGIDVGTKAEIYRLMGQFAADGKSVVFVSSYLPELMATCDTIGVMARGRLRATRSVGDWTEQEILSVAIASQHEELEQAHA